jgi:hypothetical protein
VEQITHRPRKDLFLDQMYDYMLVDSEDQYIARLLEQSETLGILSVYD